MILRNPQNPVVFLMSFGRQSTLKSVKKGLREWAGRKSLHHVPDALCQHGRALIDCTLIKERCCSVPFFLFILTLFIWFWRGHSWAQCVGSFGALCECLVRLREFIFLPTCPFHSTVRSERWLRSGASASAVCHREVQHVTDRRWEDGGR